MAAEGQSRPAAGAGRRFARYGRLSTKDKQDPRLSFPSQRDACAAKAEGLGGEIVREFTDQEAGRRDDRAGWAELLREAKERDARRFDAVIVYGTSRLSRDLLNQGLFERLEIDGEEVVGGQFAEPFTQLQHLGRGWNGAEVEASAKDETPASAGRNGGLNVESLVPLRGFEPRFPD